MINFNRVILEANFILPVFVLINSVPGKNYIPILDKFMMNFGRILAKQKPRKSHLWAICQKTHTAFFHRTETYMKFLNRESEISFLLPQN